MWFVSNTVNEFFLNNWRSFCFGWYRLMVLGIALLLSFFVEAQDNKNLKDIPIDDPVVQKLWDSLKVYNDANQYYEAVPLLHRLSKKAKQSGESEVLASCYEILAELTFFEGKYEESKFYRQELSVFFLETKKWDHYVGNLRRLANISSRIGDIPTSAKYLFEAKQHIPKLTNKKHIFQIYNAIGNMYSNQGMHDSAYHYQKLVLENVSDMDTLFLNVGNLSIAKSLIGIYDYDRAMTYAMEGLSFTDSIKQPITYSRTLGRVGQVYYLQGGHNEAERYIKKAISHATGIKNNNGLLGKLYTLAALNNIKLENYQKAKDQLSIAEPFQQKENRSLLLDFYLAKWELAIIEKNKLESTKAYESAKELTDHKDLVRISNFLRSEAKYHELMENYPQALLTFDAYGKIRDTIRNIQNVKTVQNLEIKYQTEKKDLEIVAANDRIQLQTYGMIAGGLMLSGLFFLLVRNIRDRKKIVNQSSVISKSLFEKEILLKEIHHRVKNNLQVISSLLSIQSRSIKNVKAKEAILEGKTRVHSMSLIHQDLYKKDNLTGVRMDRYLGNLTQDLLNTYNVSEAKIELTSQIEPLKLDVESVIPLGLIVNELMSNALKYAFPDDKDGIIDVSLKEDAGILHLKIADNGIGLNQDQLQAKKDSFGHTLIRAFKGKLDAEIDISGNQGTVVSLKIKKYKKVV